MAKDNPPVPTPPHSEGCRAPHGGVDWIDVDQRTWRIEFTPRRIVLCSGDEVIDLPAGAWAKDIYIAQHGTGFIVRIETFESAIRFVVSREAAAPFLAHVGMPAELQGMPAKPEAHTMPDAGDAETGGDTPLLWPKVSPLAVWAVIASAIVFIPVLGLLPALATVILLILHRVKVRRARAWHHSQALCVAATAFLVAGLL
ncbi:MAG: hypothetical protein WBE26_15930, partial [Phycisphaerae bacterium]